MAGHLRLLPRRQRAIGAGEQVGALAFQARDLAGDVEVALGGGGAQFGMRASSAATGFSNSR
jgi:hypothetical protein